MTALACAPGATNVVPAVDNNDASMSQVIGDASMAADDGTVELAKADCDGLLARHIASVEGIPCGDDAHTLLESGHRWSTRCRGLTPNQCLAALYDDPPELTVRSGSLVAHYLPACEAGQSACPDEELRCTDGTRPLYYVDKAVDPQGRDIDSNNWVFFLGGEGGACYAEDCLTNYETERQSTMSTFPPDFPNSPVDHVSPEGLLRPGPFRDGSMNAFAGFNRVRIEKCTADFGVSESDEVVTSGDSVAVFHHGARLWRRLFASLATSGDDLPDFSEARTVLIAGHSEGAKGLMYHGDALAEQIRDMSPEAQVRLAFDGHLVPMLEVEAAFQPSSCSGWSENNSALGPDIFDGHYGNENGCLLPTDDGDTSDDGYGADAYLPGGRVYESARGLSIERDKSCRAVHGEDDPRCYDELHILMNHLSTPFFLRMDKRDTAWTGSPPSYALNYSYALPQAEFSARVGRMVDDYLSHYHSLSEQRPGGPDATGTASEWNPGLFVTDVGGRGSHSAFTNETWFFDRALRKCGCTQWNGNQCTEWRSLLTYDLSEVLFAWLGEPADAETEWAAATQTVTHDGAGRELYSWVDAGESCPP